MEKEEVLNKARSDHSRQEPRRHLLERNAGYLSFIALSAIGVIWKLAEWFIDQALGTASINGLFSRFLTFCSASSLWAWP